MCEKERGGSDGHGLPRRFVTTAGLVVLAIAAMPVTIVLGLLGGLDDC